MKVLVEKILYSDRLRAAFRAVDDSGQKSRYVTDKLPRQPQEGEGWDVEFIEEEHPAYGIQRKVSKATLLRPTGQYIVHLLSKHPRFRGLGVGVVMARRLYEAHGQDLVDILTKGDIEKLQDLDSEVAFELCERWNELSIEPAVVQWLDERGADVSIASKVVSIYGNRTIEALEANPYCLLPWMQFDKIDRFALALGIEVDDPRRLVAAVEAVLYQDIDKRGNTATRLVDLEYGVRSLLACATTGKKAVEAALHDEVAFPRGEFVQAYAPAVMERSIEAWIGGPPVAQLEFGANSTDLDLQLTQLCSEPGMQLTEEQRRAVLSAFNGEGNVHCILGGAGVGKTTVLRALVKMILANGRTAHLMAIAGRAARRIAESLGELAENCTVTTVAAYLRSVAPMVDADSCPLLIVDEASMLDLQNAYKLLTHSPRHSRVILVGDQHQLPPVGAGLILHRLVENPQVPRSELTQVFRHAAETGIPVVANQVRAGLFPRIERFREALSQGVQFFNTDAAGAIDAGIEIRDLLANYGEVQVLTVFRRDTAAINTALHQRLDPTTPRLTYPLSVGIGEPIMFTRNDQELNLQNGSLGKVEDLDPSENKLTARWDDGEVREISGENLWYSELAYAITTHKAQGSQYERVVVVVTRSSRILDRTLVYTAITRARQQVVLAGNIEAVKQAIIEESNASKRITCFLSP